MEETIFYLIIKSLAMQKIFVPGIKLINKLKYPQKFGLISILLILFVIALLIIIVWELNHKINFIQKERTGIEYIKPIKDLLFDIEEYGGLLRLHLNGYKDVKPEMDEKKILITKNLNKIMKINEKHKNIFDISKDFEEIAKGWNNLEENQANFKYNEIFQEYAIITQKTVALITAVADRSNLTLDPKVYTFYLSRSITRHASILTQKTGIIRYLGLETLIKKRASEELKKELLIQVIFFKSSLETINDQVGRVFKEKEEAKDILEKLFLDLNNTAQFFFSLIDEKILNAQSITAESEEVFISGTKVFKSIFKFYEKGLIVLDNLLQGEIDELKRMRFLIIFPSILILIGLTYIFSCFTLSIVNAVKYLLDKALRISEGDLSVRSELKTKDELKSLSDAMNKMAYNLKTLIEREKITKNIIISCLESSNLKDALRTIILDTAKIFNMDRCFFIEYDADNNSFLPIEKNLSYVSSSEVEFVCGLIVSIKEMKPYTDIVFHKKRVLAINNVEKIDLPIFTKELMKKFKVKSFMIAPLFFASKPIGLLVVNTVTEPRIYTDEDIALFESIANNSSIALNQTNLMEELKEKSDDLEKALYIEKILGKITAKVNLLTTHEEVDNYILAELLNLFKVDKSIHLHVEFNCLSWYGRNIKGGKQEILKGQTFMPEETAAEIIPKVDEIIIIENVEKEVQNELLKNSLKNEGIKSLIAYPTSKKLPGVEEKGVIEITLIADSVPKIWTIEEQQLFKLVMDTLFIVALEIIQRQKIEELRKTFITALTHDLKSPILAEQKAVEALLSGKIGFSKDLYNEYLNDIHKTNEGLLKLINNLLSVYHYESGKWELHKTLGNIENEIKEAISVLKYMADDRNAKISLDIQENLPLVNIDVDEIKRALINLIENAIKHNEKGVKIVVSAVKTDDSIQISVNDNGVGIPEEVASKLFQKYMTEKGAIGSGLGLYISKQIVEIHNGKIWFETTPGKGVTFYFTLPTISE